MKLRRERISRDEPAGPRRGDRARCVVDPRHLLLRREDQGGVQHAGAARRPVDIVATSEFKIFAGFVGVQSRGLKVTRVFAKVVPILALDDKTDPESQFSDYTSAMLQLTPIDANRVFHMLDTGLIFYFIKVDA